MLKNIYLIKLEQIQYLSKRIDSYYIDNSQVFIEQTEIKLPVYSYKER